MKVWYLGCTSIQESFIHFNGCDTCYFKFIDLDCCDNHLFDDIHPCCSVGKHYRKITKSDIFNL